VPFQKTVRTFNRCVAREARSTVETYSFRGLRGALSIAQRRASLYLRRDLTTPYRDPGPFNRLAQGRLALPLMQRLQGTFNRQNVSDAISTDLLNKQSAVALFQSPRCEGGQFHRVARPGAFLHCSNFQSLTRERVCFHRSMYQ
jgi:hypothetical protein